MTLNEKEFEKIWLPVAEKVVQQGVRRKTKEEIRDFVWWELFHMDEHDKFAIVMLQIDRVVSNMYCMA